MPYVQACLSTLIRQQGRLSSPERSLLRQIASGLAAAHDVGIVHRDFEAGNIMIDEDDQALIMASGSPARMPPQGAARLASLERWPTWRPSNAGKSVDQRRHLRTRHDFP